MTRQKKTRSAGSNGQRHLPAQEIRKTRAPKEETKKKGAGLKSGSRNSLVQEKPVGTDSKGAKDKRLGSKKPIVLVPVSEQEFKTPQPKASLAKVKPDVLSPEQELQQIENDTYLQQLLERVEQDEILTGKDAKYFNAKTARLEQLLQQLGLAEDDEDPLAEFERKDWRKDLLGDD